MDEITVGLLEPATGGPTSATIASERGVKLLALASDATTFRDLLKSARPAVAIIDNDAANGVIVPLTMELRASAIATIVVGGPADSAELSRAVRAGARGFFLKPFDPDELLATIRELGRSGSESRVLTGEGGTVTAVYGPKGGVGTTAVATSLAVVLAEGGKRVALLDLDLRFGDVGIALDITAENTVADLLAHADDIDASMIDDIFAKHPSGLRVLAPPNDIGVVDSIEPAAIERLLARLRPHFDDIVLDLASGFDDITRTVLGSADTVLLVTTPELASLRRVQRAMAAAQLDGRARIVVTRSPGKVGVTIEDIERALGRPVAARIPSDGIAVTQAQNRGMAPVDPRAKFAGAKQYRELAALVRQSAQR